MISHVGHNDFTSIPHNVSIKRLNKVRENRDERNN